VIKSRFDTEFLSVKIGYVFMRLGVSANAWTILSLFPAIAGFYMLYVHNLPYALILFAASGFMDVIDGAVARVTKSVSNLGAFLDGVIDRYVELLLYIGLLIYLSGTGYILPTPFWIVLLVFGALMPTFVRAYADHRDVVTDRDDQKKMGGLIERFERLTLIYAGMLLAVVYHNNLLLIYTVAAVALLSNLTALQRILFVVGYEKPRE
jgi:phosphatidylglycerophosphate synthase